MLTPLDMHAHIKPDIAPSELHHLGACVAAMTRSLTEYAEVEQRDDPSVAWGVGCHPSLAKAVRGFSRDAFQAALPSAPVVGEVGLDGSAKVPLEAQQDVFDSVISTLAETPRIVSIHSYRATSHVLDTIERHQPKGVVLHWWLGTGEQTRRAVDLGAYFSVNASQIGRWAPLGIVPTNRLLTETDHPFGDRREAAPQRPGQHHSRRTPTRRQHWPSARRRPPTGVEKPQPACGGHRRSGHASTAVPGPDVKQPRRSAHRGLRPHKNSGR